MMADRDTRELPRRVDQQTRRIDKARKERSDIVGETVYLGVLGLIFVLPVVGGAYLGHWLDSLSDGYSYRWTVGSIVAGVAVGAVNVWLFLRERGRG